MVVNDCERLLVRAPPVVAASCKSTLPRSVEIHQTATTTAMIGNVASTTSR